MNNVKRDFRYKDKGARCALPPQSCRCRPPRIVKAHISMLAAATVATRHVVTTATRDKLRQFLTYRDKDREMI